MFLWLLPLCPLDQVEAQRFDSHLNALRVVDPIGEPDPDLCSRTPSLSPRGSLVPSDSQRRASCWKDEAEKLQELEAARAQ